MASYKEHPITELIGGPCDGQKVKRLKTMIDMEGCILATPLPQQKLTDKVIRYGIYAWNPIRDRFIYLRVIESTRCRVNAIVMQIAKELAGEK